MSWRFWLSIGFVGHLMIFIVASESVKSFNRCLTPHAVSSLQLPDGTKAYSCRRFIGGSDDLRLRADQKWRQVVARVNGLEILEQILPAPHPGIHIRITKEEPLAFFTTGRELVIGTAWLEAQSTLSFEKAVVMAWIKATAGPDSNLDHFHWEILAETALHLRDPLGLRAPPWSEGLMTFREYCSWENRSPQHEDICGNMLDDSNRASDQPTIWGFRPFLARTLASDLAIADPAERARRFQVAVRMLAKGETANLPEDYRRAGSFRDWYDSTLIRISGNLTSRFKSRQEYAPSLADDFWLLLEGHVEILPSDDFSADRTVGIVREGKVYSLNTGKWTGFFARELSSTHRLYIDCETPSMAEVLDWRSAGAGIIRHCESEAFKLSMLELSTGSIAAYVRSQGLGPARWLHLPSYRSSAQVRGRSFRERQSVSVFDGLLTDQAIEKKVH